MRPISLLEEPTALYYDATAAATVQRLVEIANRDAYDPLNGRIILPPAKEGVWEPAERAIPSVAPWHTSAPPRRPSVPNPDNYVPAPRGRLYTSAAAQVPVKPQAAPSYASNPNAARPSPAINYEKPLWTTDKLPTDTGGRYRGKRRAGRQTGTPEASASHRRHSRVGQAARRAGFLMLMTAAEVASLTFIDVLFNRVNS